MKPNVTFFGAIERILLPLESWIYAKLDINNAGRKTTTKFLPPDNDAGQRPREVGSDWDSSKTRNNN